MTTVKEIRIAFLGTPEFAVYVLDELSKGGLALTLVVTQPDKPAGRKLQITPPPVKSWAKDKNIEVLQPETLDATFIEELDARKIDLLLVAAYGLIIPSEVLDAVAFGALNIHPSLLPQWRGASPLQAALLNDDMTGVTIIQMDEKMDHGPIVDQALTYTKNWPIPVTELQEITARQGAQMILDILPDYLAEAIALQEQDHDLATFTKKVEKADAEVYLDDDDLANYRMFCAYAGWPRAFFIDDSGKRVVITDATYEDNTFVIKKVIPEGKTEIVYEAYKASNA